MDSLKIEIKKFTEKFLETSKSKEILVVSHFDTDGISSAAIITRAFQRFDKKFLLKIVKNLDEKTIFELPKDKIILFLDLASGSFNHIAKAKLKKVFIIDHHEIATEIPEGIEIINPHLNGKERISSAGLCYLFAKELNKKNKDLSKLAVLGMIGDLLEKELDQLNHEIILDGEIKKRRGLLIYPSTRPIDRALEYSSNPYLPGITGNPEEIITILREINIKTINGKYPSLLELNEDEMSKLITAVIIRNPLAKQNEIVGDIFLIKLFNKLEDAREISAKINACSRQGESDIALQLCLEIPSATKKAEKIYAKYKQNLIEGLKYVSESKRETEKNFVIINAKEKIKDTIIGTIASILSNSNVYKQGTIIVAMAYDQDRIKISARIAGREGRNVREVLSSIILQTGGEVGGHEFAAGGTIKKEKEGDFIALLKKSLEIEMVKI